MDVGSLSAGMAHSFPMVRDSSAGTGCRDAGASSEPFRKPSSECSSFLVLAGCSYDHQKGDPELGVSARRVVRFPSDRLIGRVAVPFE